MELTQSARRAGIAYLVLAVAGVVGFLGARSQLYVADDAAATLANLVEHESLARIGILADLTVVVSQALAALYFFKLFRRVDSFAAGSLAGFGLINAVIVLTATMCSAVALHVALHGAGEVGDVGGTTLVLYHLNDAAWTIGGLFFGLWLIPMGWLARRSGMPGALGWVLILGGIGYVASAYVAYAAPDATALVGALPMLATVGEIWMIGYLLVRGAPPAAEGSPTPVAVSP